MIDPAQPVHPIPATGRQLERLVDRLIGQPIDPDGLIHEIVLLATLFILGALLWWLLRLFTIRVIYPLIRRSRSQWDDGLIQHRFFRKFGKLAPLLLLRHALPLVLHRYPDLVSVLGTLVAIAFVLTFLQSFSAVMNASYFALKDDPKYRDKPLRSYIQLGNIIAGTIAAVIIISIVFGKNPVYIFSAMGAASAVLLLIFKDTLLGFVASVQLAVNDMVRVGDWVQLDKYGADGEVTDITLTTVKVRNWDMTYTTIPTYSFIADSVRNWRGMQESPGRRIKRALHISMGSIRFCRADDLKRYGRYQLVAGYVHDTQQAIAAYNRERTVDPSLPINGRNQTNVGIFRAYAELYLQQEPRVNKDMMLMVRQQPPTPTGLPLEVYCFSRNKSWMEFERLAADIFDHLIAAAAWFDLEVFQTPTGSDMRAYRASMTHPEATGEDAHHRSAPNLSTPTEDL
ncbi:MAG: mechanosensitive ion channel [Flavobacteriales bacterium]|nr:mechanosensitive ion channel [Flavobacteriales bacterium]